MNNLFAGGHVAEMLLVVLGAEADGLLLLWQMRGQGVPPWPLLAFLGAGACLALALRAALLGDHLWVGIWLAAALPPHLAWLAMAWRRR